MKLTYLVTAASAQHALTAVAAPIEPVNPINALDKTVTRVYFGPNTPQELIERAAHTADKKGTHVLGYFGLPPKGENMGFGAYMTPDVHTALRETLGPVQILFEHDGSTMGNFCPKGVC